MFLCGDPGFVYVVICGIVSNNGMGVVPVRLVVAVAPMQIWEESVRADCQSISVMN